MDSLRKQLAQLLLGHIPMNDAIDLDIRRTILGIGILAATKTGDPFNITATQDYWIQELIVQQQIGTTLHKAGSSHTNFDRYPLFLSHPVLLPSDIFL
jgi:hypothetical protein